MPKRPQPEVPLDFPREWVDFTDPDDAEHVVRADLTWLCSRWTCIFGAGCHGIVRGRPDDGCCTHGAFFTDTADQKRVRRAMRELTPETWQLHDAGQESWTERDSVGDEHNRKRTRVVDGACIFLNRPGFQGGAGCALHVEAVRFGESPIDWKPSVCWQLPLKVDWEPGEGDTEVATVRGWERRDWGAEGRTMAWCCTEGSQAYVGEAPVVDSLSGELEAIVGTTVYVELRRRLSEHQGNSGLSGPAPGGRLPVQPMRTPRP